MKLVETAYLIYKELFTINIVHSGYDSLSENMLSDVIKLYPDEATEVLFKNYNMNYCFNNDTLICYIRCKLLNPPAKDPEASYIQISNDLRLRFLLTVGNDFMSKTKLEPAGKNQLYYYFSNKTNAGVNMLISHDNSEVSNNDLKQIADTDLTKRIHGVIDIFSSGAINSNYELFSGVSQQLQSPEYRIQFRSNV